jgi:hypothetical protein
MRNAGHLYPPPWRITCERLLDCGGISTPRASTMNGAGAVSVAAISLTTCGQAPSLLALISPAAKTATGERRDWAVRSVRVTVPKAVLAATLLVVFTVYIAIKVVRNAVSEGRQPMPYS